MAIDIAPRVDGQAHAAFDAAAAQKAWIQNMDLSSVEAETVFPDHVNTLIERGLLVTERLDTGSSGTMVTDSGEEIIAVAGETFPLGKLVKGEGVCSTQPLTPMRHLTEMTLLRDFRDS